ncbi:MAG TPA: Slp family lipoprotein, partial [Nitrospira sp.]|nr:Slp family lipoprotein [Nitrospira sp.]
MTRYGGSVLLVIGLALAACGPPQIFPSASMDGVDKNFDFTAWRNVPNAQTDRKVQLGGRIVQSNREQGAHVIIVTQLPIVEQPAYGPKD